MQSKTSLVGKTKNQTEIAHQRKVIAHQNITLTTAFTENKE